MFLLEQQKQFHVFSGGEARGNPALVSLVNELPTLAEHRQFIGRDSTSCVYIAPQSDNTFGINWFQHGQAIARCGHGTLAAAAYLQQGDLRAAHLTLHRAKTHYIFQSATECLAVSCHKNNYYSLALPSEKLETPPLSPLPFQHQQWAQTKTLNGYLIAQLARTEELASFTLTPEITAAIEQRALIISAQSQSSQYDIYFRYFAPQYGNKEDSATGSAASVIWPFYSSLVHKKRLHCYQASATGGDMWLSYYTTGALIKNRIHLKDSVSKDRVRVMANVIMAGVNTPSRVI